MYKVSVCMTTYNQEKYIAEAIESVLSQKTDFPVQLVIGDDCSTDGTLGRCVTPEANRNVAVCHSSRNIGLARNLARTWVACSGQYIAMLEGDDYWYSKEKLQRQVDFMDTHPEHSMCFTRTTMVDNRTGHTMRQFPNNRRCKPVMDTTDVIRHNLMANCSVMYRAGTVKELPNWMLDLPYCDLALHCLHSLHGTIGYIPETMAVYRMHDENMFERRPLMERVAISTKVYEALAKELPKPYNEQAKQTLALIYSGLALGTAMRLPMKEKLGLPTIFAEELLHLWRCR